MFDFKCDIFRNSILLGFWCNNLIYDSATNLLKWSNSKWMIPPKLQKINLLSINNISKYKIKPGPTEQASERPLSAPLCIAIQNQARTHRASVRKAIVRPIVYCNTKSSQDPQSKRPKGKSSQEPTEQASERPLSAPLCIAEFTRKVNSAKPVCDVVTFVDYWKALGQTWFIVLFIYSFIDVNLCDRTIWSRTIRPRFEIKLC